MSKFEGFETMRLVKVGPNLHEWLERWIAAAHHEAVISRLRCFREGLEHDMAPEQWTVLRCPAVLLLSDVCDALGLLEEEKASILGLEGMVALQWELGTCSGDFNARQVEALGCVHKCGKITLSTYRAICPHWSDETLRLDLADLVKRGLLVKNGTKRGTYYVPAE